MLSDFPLLTLVGFSICVNLLRLVLLTDFICYFPLVLGIHKLPANAATDITFPMKGWRGMVDWAKNSEDKVTVSKSILSSGLTGRQHSRNSLEETVFFTFYQRFLPFGCLQILLPTELDWLTEAHHSVAECKEAF